jgi:hypothetical protein
MFYYLYTISGKMIAYARAISPEDALNIMGVSYTNVDQIYTRVSTYWVEPQSGDGFWLYRSASPMHRHYSERN